MVKKCRYLYNAASISYTAKQDKTSYVSVTRKQYMQNVYVKYQDANGNYSGQWGLAKSQNLYYGSSFEWSYGGNDCYNASSISKYTVAEEKNHYIYISRKKYTVTQNGKIDGQGRWDNADQGQELLINYINKLYKFRRIGNYLYHN